MNDLISIIVPIFNAEAYLQECIECILNQTHHNLEIILINDGSEDSSLDICNHYQKIDGRIKIISNRKNLGVAAARNMGIRSASGLYIGFVDADDLIDKTMYEVLLELINKQQADLCTQAIFTIRKDRRNTFPSNLISQHKALKNLLLLKFPTSVWAYLYPKQIIEDLWFNESVYFFEDLEYNFRVLLRCNRIALCRQPLYIYRENKDSTNKQTISQRRLSSLYIPKLIEEACQRQSHLGQRLRKYLTFTKSHLLVSAILSFMKSDKFEENRMIFYLEIKKSLGESFVEVLTSYYVPIRYKIIILWAAIYPKGLRNILSTIKLMR